MALRDAIFAVSGAADFMDARRDMAGLFVCDSNCNPIAGVLNRSQENLVTGNSNHLAVTVHPFNAVLSRSGALLVANDGNFDVALNSAPSANSRIDIVYVKQMEKQSPMSDSSDGPVISVITGETSASPQPPVGKLEVGALPLAYVTVPAGATTTTSSGVVIKQMYPMAARTGGIVSVRSTDEMNKLSLPKLSIVRNLADNCDYVRREDAWMPYNGQVIRNGLPFFPNDFLRLEMHNGVVFANGLGGPKKGANQSNMYNAKADETIPVGWRPKNVAVIKGVNLNNLQPYSCLVYPDGSIYAFGACRDSVHMNASGYWPVV